MELVMSGASSLAEGPVVWALFEATASHTGHTEGQLKT